MLTKLGLECGIKHDICHATEVFYVELSYVFLFFYHKAHQDLHGATLSFSIVLTKDNKLSYSEHKAIYCNVF